MKKTLISIALSALTAFSSGAVALTAALGTASPVVYASDGLTNQDKKMLKTEEKMIFSSVKLALGQSCPWIGLVTDSLDMFLGLTGFLDSGGSGGNDISKEDLEKLRTEINEQLSDIKMQIAATGEFVTEEFNNTIISNSFGKGLDTLHSSIDVIARQIESTRRNNKLNENEKLVEIASKIGSSSEWAKSTDNIVNQMAVTRSLLKGTTFSDLYGRDIYEVLYDHYKTKCLFTSEVYDKETPYIQRAVCEYFYDYSVMIECMEAALKISRFTDEEVNELSANQKNKYYSIVSLDTVIEDEIAAQTLEMFNIHSEDSVISRYLTYMYNAQNSRYTYINKGKVIQPVKPELGSYTPGLEADVAEIKVINTNGSDSTAAHNAYNNSATSRYENAIKNNYYITPDRIKEMPDYINSVYSGRYKSIIAYLADRGFTYTASGSNTDMLVTNEALTEWDGYFSKNNHGEYDYWKTKGYYGIDLSKQSFSSEKFGLYTYRHKKVHDKFSYQSIAFTHYYSAYSTNENKNKPVRICYFEKDSLKNNTAFSVEKDEKTGKSVLHVDGSSTGSAGSVKCTIMYRKNGDRFWTESYVPSAAFPLEDYPDCQFKTVITDSAGNKEESQVYQTEATETLVPASEPYMTESGEYIPGNVEYISYKGKYYSVNAGGTRGDELSSVEISCFVFELLDTDEYRINFYTGSYDALTNRELIIPKLYKGKKVTSLGTSNYDGFMNRATGNQKQFTLVLNENIKTIKSYAFNSAWVSKVSGNTSALCKIEKQAFAYTNNKGWYQLRIQFDYPGEIKIGEHAFEQLTVYASLRHETTLSSTGNASHLNYSFTDSHICDTPEWTWADDYSSAKATFICQDERCKRKENVKATVTKDMGADKIIYTAAVQYGNKTYTDTKTTDQPYAYYPAAEPYIDDSGAYILGCVEHYKHKGKYYAVNADKSIGEEITDIWVSYFELGQHRIYRKNIGFKRKTPDK